MMVGLSLKEHHHEYCFNNKENLPVIWTNQTLQYYSWIVNLNLSKPECVADDEAMSEAP